MTRMPKDPSRTGLCPACDHERPLASQRGLLDAERAWFVDRSRDAPPGHPFAPLPDGMQRLAANRGTAGRWFWACDLCLKSGRALGADVRKQHLGLGTPFAAYVDRPFACADCGAPSVFTAREQQHWFEALRFLIWVHPKECLACRRKRHAKTRTNTALAEALAGLDAKDASQLDAVAALYAELGATTKAEEFRARARNRRKRG